MEPSAENRRTVDVVKGSATDVANHIIGKNALAWGIAIIVMAVVILALLFMNLSAHSKLAACESGTSKSSMQNYGGNLAITGNSPQWQNQMGDAGWGGPMHSTYQTGEARVWGASAEGPDTDAVIPTFQMPWNAGQVPAAWCGSPGSAAVGEAAVLSAAGGFDPASVSSAKNMDDSALVRIMNGGSA